MAIDSAWLDARIVKTKALIESYEDALLAIASGAQQYSFDTGQTRQTVTRANVASARLMLLELENRLEILCARRDGDGTFIARPGF